MMGLVRYDVVEHCEDSSLNAAAIGLVLKDKPEKHLDGLRRCLERFFDF